MRVGFGNDMHQLGANRPLVIGGVTVPSPLGAIAHSDGDVLLHATIDALLGGLALGDIGDFFPPSDPQYRDIDSQKLLATVLGFADFKPWAICNLDAVIELESPKLGTLKLAIRENLAKLLQLELSQVSIKAKTNEKLDAVGQNRAIKASVVLLLAPKPHL